MLRTSKLFMSVPKDTKDKITNAAKEDGLPVSRWLERVAMMAIQGKKYAPYMGVSEVEKVYGEQDVDRDKRILAMYSDKREKGIFLSEESLEAERIAFIRVHQYERDKSFQEELSAYAVGCKNEQG